MSCMPIFLRAVPILERSVNFVRSPLSSAGRRISFRTPLTIRVKASLFSPTNGLGTRRA
jgi:hypothetical protein